MPLNQKTAGKPKKEYMTGFSARGKELGSRQLDKLHNQLMEYANAMEKDHPARAQTLKAELHKRATELSLAEVEDNAEMVHNGATQTHQGYLRSKS